MSKTMVRNNVKYYVNFVKAICLCFCQWFKKTM